MTVIANTVLKLGSKSVPFDGPLMGIILGYLTSPLIVSGFALYAMAAVLWIYCLSKFDLSYVTFVSSAQYVLLIAVSLLVFNEQISMMKWAGTGFILVGVFFWLKG
ncbi:MULTISPECIES: EamA family transporter [Paenibacillus]|uniref:EamA family transporter n=1 Tax=Paenibacillus radicis (ex Xue et al. 2023) TaxID=2972489 RepID=A0ABT1YUX8_9BACL|nr:EamA family transporter [Paenibacillus radicis (ex Xue et al. 2023)]MCR8636746.1 EamA family transporter [Paenibacillus radicis (ex Xue et al. 2023)]